MNYINYYKSNQLSAAIMWPRKENLSLTVMQVIYKPKAA